MKERIVSVYEHIKALWPAGIGNLLPVSTCTMVLALVTVIVWATSAPAQSVPDKPGSINAGTLSSAQLKTATITDAENRHPPSTAILSVCWRL